MQKGLFIIQDVRDSSLHSASANQPVLLLTLHFSAINSVCYTRDDDDAFRSFLLAFSRFSLSLYCECSSRYTLTDISMTFTRTVDCQVPINFIQNSTYSHQKMRTKILYNVDQQSEIAIYNHNCLVDTIP